MNKTPEIEEPRTDTIRRIVARQQLGVLETSVGLAAHQLACQRIRSLQFSPPADLHAAIQTLTEGSHGPKSVPVEDPDFCERVLRFELQRFCSEFYFIAPSRRTDIWNQLNRRAETFPQLRWKMKWIAEGLTVIRPHDEDDTRVAALARMICDISVMSPAASVAALNQVCQEALNEDNGVAIGDDFVELSRLMPEIDALRPAMILPATLRQIRRLQKNHHTPSYDPNKIVGVQTKAAFQMIFFIVSLVAGGLFLASVIAGLLGNDGKSKEQLSPEERYGFGRLGTMTGSTPKPKLAPSGAAKNPHAEDSEPDHPTGEMQREYRVLPSGRIEAKESWKEWPNEEKGGDSVKPGPMLELHDFIRQHARDAEATKEQK